MTSVKTIISALCLACIASAPALAKPISILGTWTITTSTPAPWVKPGEPTLPSDDKDLLGRQIVFAKTRITAPSPPLNPQCRNPHYTLKDFPLDFLFEGGLTEPDKQAGALGFKGKTVPTVETGCEGVSDFHFLDNDTALFGLNNRVFRIERKKR